MRAGYSRQVFHAGARVLLADGSRPRVTMQIFGKAPAFLGGIDEASPSSNSAPSMDDLEVWALHDGDAIEPWETVLLIEGRTMRSPTSKRSTWACWLGGPGWAPIRGASSGSQAEGSDVFPARHDHWLVQTGDGYAAHIAGAIGVSTDAQASWWGTEGVGTVPHALIAAYGGDTVQATRKFAQHIDPMVRLVTLVDFENDCVGTSLRVAEAVGKRLYGVRIDTSEMLVDRSVVPQMGRFRPTGVCPQLVWNVRKALDQAGYTVKSWYPAASPSRRSGTARLRAGGRVRCRLTGASIQPTSCD
jgi:nicotinate phosphoribosyltransferase